jgi:drug/metabolite transporter (DMT)-like permease
MIYLGIAILLSSSLFVLFKFTEKYKSNRLAISFFIFLSATIFTLIFVFKEVSNDSQWLQSFISGLSDSNNSENFMQISPSFIPLIIGFLNGFIYFGAFHILQVSTARNGSAMTSTFNKLGVMIPAVLSVIFFNEVPKILQVIGIVFALLAIMIINFKKEENSVITMKAALAGTFLLGGLADFTSKVYQVIGLEKFQSLFILFTFMFGMLVTGLFILSKDRRIKLSDAVFGIVAGIPSQLISLFLLRSLTTVPAFVVFPLFSVGVILIVNIINLLFFREKLTKSQVIAMGFIMLSIILLNI